jgi:hypothetical protein
MKTIKMIDKKIKKVIGKTIIAAVLAFLIGGLWSLPASANDFRRSGPPDRDRYENRDRDKDRSYYRYEGRDRDRDVYYRRTEYQPDHSRRNGHTPSSIVIKLPPPPGFPLFPQITIR